MDNAIAVINFIEEMEFIFGLMDISENREEAKKHVNDPDAFDYAVTIYLLSLSKEEETERKRIINNSINLFGYEHFKR